MCHFDCLRRGHRSRAPDRLQAYFAAEIADLREMEKGGLLTIDDRWISVQPRGRLLVRAIAMVFDRYLRADRERARYSKVI
jgi:oxygen-independent coproporphyrinogen-3 oxidase